jgi:hypothetical protein
MYCPPSCQFPKFAAGTRHGCPLLVTKIYAGMRVCSPPVWQESCMMWRFFLPKSTQSEHGLPPFFSLIQELSRQTYGSDSLVSKPQYTRRNVRRPPFFRDSLRAPVVTAPSPVEIQWEMDECSRSWPAKISQCRHYVSLFLPNLHKLIRMCHLLSTLTFSNHVTP